MPPGRSWCCGTSRVRRAGAGKDYESFDDPAAAFRLTVRAYDGTYSVSVTAVVAVTDLDEPEPVPALPLASAISLALLLVVAGAKRRGATRP